MIGAASQDFFTSYSANFEDVILHRLFVGRPSGFYVDVGAAHPTFENDTRFLYERGWNGINIEPNPAFFDHLVVERARDRNLCVALSDRSGEICYYDVIGTGLSTCNPKLARRARRRGYSVVHRRVPVTTLAQILGEADPRSIELLKIDVEGLEEQVLAGNDWSSFRPSVIVVEATFPESPRRRPTNIRPYLKGRKYRWCYFDGLNDFYVEKSFEVPKGAFDCPPNIFDRFKLREVVDLQRHSNNLSVEVAGARQCAKGLEAALDHSKLQVAEAQRYAKDLEAALDHSKLESGESRALERERSLSNQQQALLYEVAYHLARSISGQKLSIDNIVDENGLYVYQARRDTSMTEHQGKIGESQSGSVVAEQFGNTFLRVASESLQSEIERARLDLADEKFERQRLAHAADTMRQQIIQYSRELEKAHSEGEALIQTRLLLARAEENVNHLREQIVLAEARAHVESRIALADQRAAQFEAQYQQVLSSTSWALTGPIRAVGRIMKRVFFGRR